MTPWVDDSSVALLTDLYQLTMAQAYFERGFTREAVFELFVRKLPPRRNYLVACGLDDALHFLETLRFGPEAVATLSRDARFKPAFLDRLASLRFTGDVDAVPEGTPVFPGEPLLQVVGPLPEAQLAETFLLNQIVFQTIIASKAARVVAAAQGRTVIDFGLRRMHGTDAGMKAARAAYIAGVDGTSDVLAAAVYGIPASGTMAHSYVQAHESELDAFREFAALYPDTVLLVDTYDSSCSPRSARCAGASSRSRPTPHLSRRPSRWRAARSTSCCAQSRRRASSPPSTGAGVRAAQDTAHTRNNSPRSSSPRSARRADATMT
ncbi:MAG TPA: nicotinate phosphoribosyltransferase [Myxococcales bacterium]|nr:nicotinate phosphoribosyltransferase [Myxococcales bacterium]